MEREPSSTSKSSTNMSEDGKMAESMAKVKKLPDKLNTKDTSKKIKEKEEAHRYFMVQ